MSNSWLVVLSRLFGLLFSYLLIYSQRFSRCALRPSSSASFRIRELSDSRTNFLKFRLAAH